MYKAYNRGKEIKGYLIESKDFVDFNHTVRKKRLTKKDREKVLNFCAYFPENAQLKVGLTAEEVLSYPWDNYCVPDKAYINKCDWVHDTSILLYDKDGELVVTVSIDSDMMKVSLAKCDKYYIFYNKDGRIMLDDEAFVRNSLCALPVVDEEAGEYKIIVPRLDTVGYKGYSEVIFDMASGDPVGVDSRDMNGNLLDYKPFISNGVSMADFIRE